MALTPESRPTWQKWGHLQPANTIVPQVGVSYDAAGTPTLNYVYAPTNAAGQSIPAPGSASPSTFAAITPSDSTVLSGLQGVWVGGTGTLVVKGLDGVTATFSAVPAGTLIRGQFSRVMAATTATLLVALS